MHQVAKEVLSELKSLEPFPDAEGTSLLPRIRGEEPEIEPLAFAETLMPRLEFGWSDLAMVRDVEVTVVR